MTTWRSWLMSYFWRIVARIIRIGAQIVLRVRPQWIKAYAHFTLPIIAYRVRKLTEDNDA